MLLELTQEHETLSRLAETSPVKRLLDKNWYFDDRAT